MFGDKKSVLVPHFSDTGSETLFGTKKIPIPVPRFFPIPQKNEKFPVPVRHTLTNIHEHRSETRHGFHSARHSKTSKEEKWKVHIFHRTWIHDNLCDLITIKSDTGWHSRFLRCFFLMNAFQEGWIRKYKHLNIFVVKYILPDLVD